LTLRSVPLRVEGFGKYHFSYPGRVAMEEIEHFFEAFHIMSSTHVTWCENVIQPDNWIANLQTATDQGSWTPRRGYENVFDNVRDWRNPASAEVSEDGLRQVLHYHDRLRTAHKGVRVAATRLSLSLTRTTDPDRIIDLCIGIEALLGSGFSETVHRLSMRSSAAYALIRDLYSYRSRVVHGDPGPYKKHLLEYDQHSIHASRFATEPFPTC
jgi:hypothetical protein